MKRTIRSRTLSGTTSTELQPWEKAHMRVAQEAAEEGIVLLKNDGILPLQAGSSLALYGAGAEHTIKGGTGSGDVNERHSVTIAEGLRAAGFQLTTEEWLRDYEERYQAARIAWRDVIHQKAAQMEGMHSFFFAYTATPFDTPAGQRVTATDADVAVCVISRVAGEGADRFNRPGDYLLSEYEHDMLRDACAAYRSVIVIVNAGGVIDLSFMDEFANIGALLVISQPGMMGGHAVAAVLNGAVNPSGHLSDTWAYRYADYPTAEHFSHNDGDLNNAFYEEGIYVGYRYFDTFNVPVRYGFGEGVSYTDFSITLEQVTTQPDGKAEATVRVVNTGSMAGKAVAQLYAQLPLGQMEKEARRLVAFGKTSLLAPGAAETLTLTFDAWTLASFDEAACAWKLERGLYGLYLGASLRDSVLCACLHLEEDTVLQRVAHICPLQQPLQELQQAPGAAEARYQQLLDASAALPCLPYTVAALPDVDYTEPAAEAEAGAIAEQLTVDQLVRLAIGDPGRGQGSALGSAGISVPGSAGETSDCAAQQGVAAMVLADGPAGLRLTRTYYVKDGAIQPVPLEMSMENGFLYCGEQPEGEAYYQFCTAIPVGTMLAQTWNTDLVARCGDAVGEEMLLYHVTLWLAPGMNIHRDPLCGRNFEYYAEDPLLTGRMAGAMTLGVQKHPGCGTTIKHFACNSQEDNRMGADSVLSERTLREIYLRGFGIAIREAKPLSIMTSYNLINGVHAANSYDLCMRVARCEFGFDGVIMTDWTTTNHDESCTAAGCMRAGNDLVMPGLPMDHENLHKELAAGTLSLEQLRACVARMIRVALLSDSYE